MKFWMWRWPTLSFGIALLMAVMEHNLGMVMVLLFGAIGTAWLRKEVNHEVRRIIDELEEARPLPEVSMAGWFKEGWDFARSNSQAAYEVVKGKKGREELMVGEYKTTASKQKAFVPHLRIGADYYTDMLEAYVKAPNNASAAVKH